MMQQVAHMRRALIKRNAQFFDWFVDNVGIQNIQMMHKKPVHNTSSPSPQLSTPLATYRHGMPCCFFVYQLIQTFFCMATLLQITFLQVIISLCPILPLPCDPHLVMFYRHVASLFSVLILECHHHLQFHFMLGPFVPVSCPPTQKKPATTTVGTTTAPKKTHYGTHYMFTCPPNLPFPHITNLLII
jgi:hypothetical protein